MCQICVCLLRHAMLPGNVERGGRTGAVNVLGWRTIKGSSMAESDSLVAQRLIKRFIVYVMPGANEY